LRLAQEWQRQLDDGEIESQAAIARREGITRARVSQIMSLLRLAPKIRELLLSGADGDESSMLSERILRRVVHAKTEQQQMQELGRALSSSKSVASIL
jgi:hypothetical protein